MVLHPDNNFDVERTLTKDDVQKLIKVSLVHIRMLYLFSLFFKHGRRGARERGKGSLVPRPKYTLVLHLTFTVCMDDK